jgi:hypothetical protein
MMAGISVDLRSATPPYEQIRTQIGSLITAVDRYIAEGRDAGLDDGALLGILRVRLGHPQ